MSKTASTVGIDPAGAEVLVRELQDAERLSREAPAEREQLLRMPGVATLAAAELDVSAPSRSATTLPKLAMALMTYSSPWKEPSGR